MLKSKILINSFIALLLLTIKSANSAETDFNLQANNVDISTGIAHPVITGEQNQQVKNLAVQENLTNQQQAIKEGRNFVTTAPDKNNPDFWKEKNISIDNSINSAGTEPTVNQEDVNQQKQVLKDILDRWEKQKAEFTNISITLSDDKNFKEKNQSVAQERVVTALAGTRWYATMAGGADSYVPGMIRAQLQEGSFAGSYVLGKFQIAPDGEHVMIIFDTLSDGKKTYSISAVAVDPHSEISGITGDIDHHIFKRYVVPAAVGFLQGAVNLLKTNQSVVMNGQTTTVAGPSLSNAQLGLMMAASAADNLKEATAPKGVLNLPQVKIESGASLGILLIKSI